MNKITVDFQQFERQKRALFQMSIRDEYADARHDEVKELIDGAIALFDAISDANQLSGGEPIVIYATHQYPNADTIELLHEHDYDRCIPLFTPAEHKGVSAAIWDCSDFIEEHTNV